MLGTGIFQDDGSITVLHQFTDTAVDLDRLHVGRVDLGPFVEIHIRGIEVGKATFLVEVKEDLLRAAGQLLRMHPHFMGEMLLCGHVRHTRTSSSYGSHVSISCGMMLRIATSSDARATTLSLS